MAADLVPQSARHWAAHRLRAWRESSRALRCDVLVLSRAKSGRTWLRALLSRLYQQHYGLREAQLLEFDEFHAQEPAIPKVFFTHGHYLRERFDREAYRRRFGARRLVFLVRHPCDVAVSEYFQSTRRARPHKRALHGVADELPLYEFVMESALGLPAIVDYLNAWARRVERFERSLQLRYEDLRARPQEQLSELCAFLEAPFSAAEIAEAVDFADFEKLRAREREGYFRSSRLAPRDPQDPDSYKVRRGKVGGYADYFDARQRAAMESLVRERLDPRFGYGEPPSAIP